MVQGISGGPIEQFREGWAIIPFIHKPHYWQRMDLSGIYSSLCGLYNEQWNIHQRPLTPGVFLVERCKRCQRKHQKRLGHQVTETPK